jgi:1,4-alpha-glucan branching enzyme
MPALPGRREMDVDVVILLHSHMPYVRRNGDWPVGEQWILESWAESYIPLWEIIEDLTAGALPGRLALTVTPVLAEQLKDEYLQERFEGYLENRIRQAGEEIVRLQDMGDEPRSRLAAFFEDECVRRLRIFEERFRGRMMEVLERGMAAGAVEVLASAATHAHLPSLGSDGSRRAQIGIGLESYRRCFGREAEGFWLPECSYTPDLDAVLSGYSPPLRYVILDHTAVESAPEDAPTWEARRLGSTPLLVMLRDRTAHELVWTPQGYPAHGDYREYMKRDHDGHGFQYWRITSRAIPLDEKDLYYPDRAAERARKDALDFSARIAARREEILSAMRGERDRGLLLAAYDTELFGHWWREGPLWLREVLRLMGTQTELPSRAIGKAAEDPSTLTPRMTAWNVDGTFSTWVNEDTADIWEKTCDAERKLLHGLQEQRNGPEVKRALLQAAREALLMEASDWTYMITRDAAAAYARGRFESHRGRFSSIMDMLERGKPDAGFLADLEETDNLFGWLNLGYWE